NGSWWLSGQFLQRGFGIGNKLVHLFLRDADDNSGPSDAAADSDATGIRPDLSMGGGNRREEEDAQCRSEGQMPLHGGPSHFGPGAQSELVVVPAVMVEPVTSRPMAMPPHFAWTLEGVGSRDVASGDFRGEKKKQRPAKSPAAETTTPPPSPPRSCCLLLSRKNRHKAFMTVVQHVTSRIAYPTTLRIRQPGRLGLSTEP